MTPEELRRLIARAVERLAMVDRLVEKETDKLRETVDKYVDTYSARHDVRTLSNNVLGEIRAVRSMLEGDLARLQEVDGTLDPADLRVDIFRDASGYPKYKVRVTHLPTGKVGESTEKHYSGLRAKEEALTNLYREMDG